LELKQEQMLGQAQVLEQVLEQVLAQVLAQGQSL
jgi:hypothetical protein